MKTTNNSKIDKLTALWALNESGLGGFLHVFSTPFTGLLVGGISILMISLIAFYAKQKWQSILKALVIVLLIKMAVSPYSPVGAYLAVSFQAVFGAFLLSKLSWRSVALPILGMVTFLQSALQKLVILTIIYGTGFWEAIEIYGHWVSAKMGVLAETSASSILISIYLFIYGSCGIFAGFFIRNMIDIIANKPETDFYLQPMLNGAKVGRKGYSLRLKFIWVWLIVVGFVVLVFGLFGESLFPWQKAIYIVLRSFFILMIWYLILGPFLLKMAQKYLQKSASKYKNDMSNAMDLFPYFRQIIAFSWQQTTLLKGYNRVKYFIANSISNCLHFKIPSK